MNDTKDVAYVRERLCTESTIELIEKIEQLEKDKDILIQVLLRHKPELRGWVEKNFKELDK